MRSSRVANPLPPFLPLRTQPSRRADHFSNDLSISARGSWPFSGAGRTHTRRGMGHLCFQRKCVATEYSVVPKNR